MPNQKISQLTPKGSALVATDLLEVSVYNGTTYDTRSVTGANVVSGLQPTLVSGTNIKTINSTSLLGSGNIVISTGLTVGTTAIASGTIGRILFEGTGNVVQQDSTLFWDNTNKRLGVVTPTPLAKLHVSSDGFGQDVFRVTYAAGATDIINAKSGGFGTGTLTFAPTDGVVCNSTLKMGHNNILGANSSYIQLENGGGGNQSMYFKTVTPSSTLGFQFLNSANTQLFQITSGGNVSIGATAPSARLDVRAQGALSTDIAFRVRNSADTANILQVLGNSTVWANGAGGVVGNTTFGQLALDANTTGVGNTAFGYNALTAVTTASASTAVGWGSLEATTNTGNTAVGHTAGQANISGTYNTYLGYSAGQYGTTAANSIFIGQAAGQNSNASNGIFIGSSASTTGGTGTIAIGYSAGAGTGLHNISMGQSSGFGMTTGNFNIHIGYRTVGSGVTTGNYNTLIGGDSVVGAVSNNVAISDGQGNKVLWFNSVNAMVSDLKIDTVTGIKIGTATTNKLSFWNATPIVQPTTAVASATVVSGSGGNVKHDDKFDGYTVEQVVRALRNTGLLA